MATDYFRRFILSLLAITACHILPAQKPRMDSLRVTIANLSLPDTTRLFAADEISWDYAMIKPDSAEYFARIAMGLADKTHLDKFHFKALNTIGASWWIRTDYAKALDYFQQAIDVSKRINFPDGTATAYNNMGNIYAEQEDYDKALQNYLESISIAKKIHNDHALLTSIANCGIIYETKGLYSLGASALEESLRLSQKMNDAHGKGTALNNIGQIFQEMYAKGDSIIDSLHNRQFTFMFRNGKPDFSLLLDSAEKAFVAGEKQNRIAMNSYGVIYSLVGQGDILQIREKYSEALPFYLRASSLSDSLNGTKEQETTAEDLYRCYKAMNDYKNALAWHEKFIVRHDSINRSSNKKALIRQQLELDYERKTAIGKEEQEKKNLRNREELRQRNFIIYGVTAGFLLVIVFSVFLFNRFRITNRQKNIIEEQKGVVEEKNKQMSDSILYAKRLQDAILPAPNVIENYFPGSFIFYKPKDIVAGDFYFFEKTAERIFIAAADCTGHGVPGAMVSVVCSNALSRSVKEFHLTEPGKILDKVKELVLETFAKSATDVNDGMDISLCSFYLRAADAHSPSELHLEWAGANNPLWLIRGNELQEFHPDKQPVGLFEFSKPFTTQNIPVAAGDMLYLFSDGFEDQFGGEKGKKFKSAKMKELLLSLHTLKGEEQKQQLEKTFETWKGVLEQVDDVLVVGIRI